MSERRVGIDIGGTFTDFVLSRGAGGCTALHKTLTTPSDPSVGALTGLDELLAREGLAASDLSEIVHGTTLVTNAVIERKGAKVGMLTTEGFRDILEMGNEQRYDIYDLDLSFPEPLVSRDLRREVAGRLDALGREVAPLDEAGLMAEARALRDAGCEALAICFMHSYRNPDHELRAAELIKAEWPDMAVSVSSAVVGEISEYPRFVTTCANAFVQPLMARYLTRLEAELTARGFTGELRLMTSAGGLVPVETARALPIRLLESGPAGGALATAWFGKAAGLPDVLSFDMGGTTAKACLIEGGSPHIAPVLEAGREHRFKNGSGLPMRAPTVDMIEIGAGGGSVAAVDDVGLLKVGPRSAGAVPGPACYGKGGSEPTVTDASVLLGYYDPDRFLGGRMTLDRSAAETAMAQVAGPLGLDPVQAAWGVHQTVAESMASAAQIHMVEKGRDPRRYAMIGFGGAGPAFAARVARVLGIAEVIIPPASGAASAFGFLSAPLTVDLVRSRPMDIDTALGGGIDALLGEMKAEALAELGDAGVAEDDAKLFPVLDIRLKGQLHVVGVPLPDAPTEAGLRAAFETVYLDRYSRRPAEAPLEILSLRLRAQGPAPTLEVGTGQRATDGAEARTRKVWTGDGWQVASVHDRAALVPGAEITGPAIIEEPESTTVVPLGDSVSADAAGNLRIKVKVAHEAAVKIPADLPLDEAKTRLEDDPIALEIMWARLVTITEDMWQTVCRTAFSLIISESQDFGCALLDPDGETIAHSARVMPVFNITLPRAVRHILKHYPAETMREGDVYVTNDPWECAGHLFDIAVVTPIFAEGRVVALSATVGHVGDIGGTRDGLSASEVYEEGLQIPPMRLVREGEESEDLFRLMEENVREAVQVLGDVRSLVTANARGAAQVRRFLAEYGLRDLRGLAAVVQDRSEGAMRAAIAALPDGTYTSEVGFNPMGTRMTIPMSLTVAGERITVDFAGAPPQVARGGINCTMSYTQAHATYPLKCMLTPGVRGNAGCYRAFEVTAPEGSILNCRKPAAVSLRTRTGWYSSPNIFRAMSEVLPGAVRAYSGLPSVLTFWGTDEEGRDFSEMLLLGGGQGAGQGSDGRGALLWPTSAASSSIELMEQRLPVVVLEKGLVTDSGGPGAARGGMATRVRVRRREAAGTMTCQVAPEGVDLPVDGLHGGLPGLSSYAVHRKGGQDLDCGTGAILALGDTSEEVELVLSAGSGFGDPAERPAAMIAEDLRLGRISEAAARDAYKSAARSEDAA